MACYVLGNESVGMTGRYTCAVYVIRKVPTRALTPCGDACLATPSHQHPIDVGVRLDTICGVFSRSHRGAIQQIYFGSSVLSIQIQQQSLQHFGF